MYFYNKNRGLGIDCPYLNTLVIFHVTIEILGHVKQLSHTLV